MKLIEEIDRCAPAFGALDERCLETLESPDVRSLIRRKNGALALSGALVLFGCGRDHTHPLHISRHRFWAARADYGLSAADDVFGADVFGDLLFVRDHIVFRLDGEIGSHIAICDVSEFFSRDLSEIAEELGGRLGREHFAGRALGEDPLRLLPWRPFMMKEHVPGDFFETPLSRALSLKHRLFLACRDAPDGAGVDCGFWKS